MPAPHFPPHTMLFAPLPPDLPSRAPADGLRVAFFVCSSARAEEACDVPFVRAVLPSLARSLAASPRLISSQAIPSSSEGVNISQAIPSSSPRLISSQAIPSSSEGVNISQAIPSSSPRLTSSQAMPSSSEGVNISQAIPSSSEGVDISQAIPSSSEGVDSSDGWEYSLFVGVRTEEHSDASLARLSDCAARAADAPLRARGLRFRTHLLRHAAGRCLPSLSLAALSASADYICLAHEAARLLPPRWAERAIARLAAADPPNFGAAAGCVHRTHLRLFGSYAPLALADADAAEWLGRVYARAAPPRRNASERLAPLVLLGRQVVRTAAAAAETRRLVEHLRHASLRVARAFPYPPHPPADRAGARLDAPPHEAEGRAWLAVAVPTCERRGYVRLCAAALAASRHPHDVHVFDDASRSFSARELAAWFGTRWVHTHARRAGPDGTGLRVLRWFVRSGAYGRVVTIDSDTIAAPEWHSRLRALAARGGLVSAYRSSLHAAERCAAEACEMASLGNAGVVWPARLAAAFVAQLDGAAPPREGFDWAWVAWARRRGVVLRAPAHSLLLHVGTHGAHTQGRAAVEAAVGFPLAELPAEARFAALRYVDGRRAAAEAAEAAEGEWVVAFALPANNSRLAAAALANAAAARRVLPGWSCRFYVDAPPPPRLAAGLAALGARVVAADARVPPALWPLLALDEPAVARLVGRRVGARLGERDGVAVGAWVHAGTRFHVVRDHPRHAAPMGAGRWAVRRGALSHVRALLHYSRHATEESFLNAVVWPIARHSVTQHDAFSCGKYEGALPFPLPVDRRRGEFVGQPFSARRADVRALLDAAQPPECVPS
ncbi:hypothetical protein AB1Y20_019723 [Prymnesium parvum]|uniref:Glycosyltransferase 2-like domain-containing protein n=1 Tax=Prymnesium parvum TaxID=97485 RepID=A0AB34JV87_PRYPA